jgi:hypothetical protein
LARGAVLRVGVSGAAATAKSRPAVYRRREPETTDLHRVVRENLEAFLRFTRDNYSKPLPRYVVRELKRYIGCGLLYAWGIVMRAQVRDCSQAADQRVNVRA